MGLNEIPAQDLDSVLSSEMSIISETLISNQCVTAVNYNSFTPSLLNYVGSLL